MCVRLCVCGGMGMWEVCLCVCVCCSVIKNVFIMRPLIAFINELNTSKSK